MSLFKRVRCLFFYMLILSSLFPSLYSQVSNGSPSNTESRKLNVYVSGFTDIPLLSDKINFAAFVSVKDSALVIVKLDEGPTESGGKKFIITFTGWNELKGINDELSYDPQVDEGEEKTKQALATMIKIAMIKYAAHTPVSENISIKYNHTEEQVAAVKDKWNYWLFNFNCHFQLNGEKSMRGKSFSGGFSARRITDAWKIRGDLNTYYNEDIFDMEEIDLSYINITRNHNFDGLIVKSLSDHWSIGSFSKASQATYYNNKFSVELAPAVEFNIFPYIESEKRSFTFLYRLGYIYRKYWEETIYGKTNEGLFETSLMADVEIFKTWGSIESSLTGSLYLKDFAQNRLTWYFEIDVRIFKRLTFDIEWRLSMIHDQLFLERGGASYEEVLLRRKQLETQYDYSIEFGIGYSFGSLNNNIVNPIFGN